LVVVTRFNLLLLPFAFVAARFLGATLVYDLFVSLHRTAAMRGYARPVVWTVSLVERLTYRLPDHLLVGTNQFIELYAQMYSIPPDRFLRVPPAADEDRFYPRDAPRRAVFTALYWGNFLPHHGVDVILDAAAILDEKASIEFVFLGTGPYRAMAEASAAEQKLSNVRFEGFVDDAELHEWIARSHVCLGVFSQDVRALASTTNKVCEAAASGKAIITEDSPAIREAFTQEGSILTVPPENPHALAVALGSLQKKPERIAQLEMRALAVHQREFSTTVIAELLLADIQFK
jgi:glycosyltransferase involved in cell wall biosynthesis